MKKNKGFIREVANSMACIAVQRRRNPMSNQIKFIRQTAVVLLAIGLILGLLPGCTAQPDADDGFEARRQWLFERLRAKGDHTYSTQNIEGGSMASLYLSDGQDEAALEHLVTVLDDMRERDNYGYDRHAGPAIVRVLYMYGDRFSADQIERIKRAVTSKTFRRVTAHGTENHAMDFVTTGYLLAQYFPGETWNTTQGLMTSQELMELNRSRIISRGKGFYRVGHAELLSTTYEMLCVRSSINLWEFARDPVVRDAGEAQALYHVGLHALNNFDGHTMPPFNRRNRLQARFPGHFLLPHSCYMAWLFWGQNEIVPPGLSDYEAEQFMRSGGFHQHAIGRETLQVASSSWRVPGPLNRIAQGADVPYEIRGANGQFGYWGNATDLGTLRYVWRDREFAIGGPVGDNFHPGRRPESTESDQQLGFYDCYEMFSIVWTSENRLRALEAMHPHWRSNSGEDHWQTTHSPFQQTGVHCNVAITMFNIPDKDPWPDSGRANWIAQRDQHFDSLIRLGQVRFPTTVDEIVENGDFYFFRECDVYVAIRVLKPGHTLHKQLEDVWSKERFHVVKSREARTGFVFEVGTADEHGSFEAFQQAVKNNPLSVDWNAMEVRYASTRGDELRFRYDTDYSEDEGGRIKIVPDLWINGKQRKVDFNTWPVAESPVMTLKDGILRIEQGGEQVEVDWSGELPRIKRR
jgi:hypothetical protein